MIQKSDNKKCPICNGCDLTLRHEASYIYSYAIDSDKPGLENDEEFRSYQYDGRKQLTSSEYIECNICHTRYPNMFLGNIL